MTVRTRFAPSPTGYLHIGGARTALFCWLFARHHGGEFILRVEDTDRERSTDAAVKAIFDGMAWLGLDSDEDPVFQTSRFDRYREAVEALLNEDKAYHCYCSKEELDAMRVAQMQAKQKPRYDGRCRHRTEPKAGVDPVVRFKMPLEGRTVVNDLVRGAVSFDNAELDDFIIARSDGSPTYNFTVVVDDMDTRISHVIRGDDHLNNTPKQLAVFHALGAAPPQYAHVPMILGPDGAKLSKRHGAVSVMQYRDDGYLPEAVKNYLVRLGWSHGDQEVFSIDEMINLFDVADINQSASAINPEKLLWLNQHYIKTMDVAVLARELHWHLARLSVDISAGPDLADIVEIQRERAKTFVEMAENCRFFFEDIKEYDEKAARKNLKPETQPVLAQVREAFAALTTWDAEPIHEVVINTAESMELKLGKVAQPIRVAISGGAVSPPIDATLALLGKAKTLARLDKAIEYISS
ncbi:MAG: glutamate--tRNA ligase [Gammaproteobacteria bacterium]|nr:glutamate--tRNA ligase [Gammaproteobacteria bacterium]